MKRIKEKKERALGVKLFLKAERCSSPKCATVRRPQRPGMHGQKRKHILSEYGRQIQEKQKIQIYFGLNERQMKNVFKNPKEKIIPALEQRLDYVFSMLGLAPSIRVARQLISHGHIMVNNRKVTIPSYHVKVGDIISIYPNSRSLKVFEDVPLKIKNYQPPSWLKLNKEELKGECIKRAEDPNFPFNLDLVSQFYSR